MYQYRAVIRSIHDGDTITVDIDLGFGVQLHDQKIRLYGINAPELSTAEGVAAREALVALAGDSTAVVLETQKAEGDREKYGRWLATVTAKIYGKDFNVNQWMVDNKHASPFMLK